MTPWISQDVAPFFSLLSLSAGLSCVEHFVRRGRQRGLVTAVYGGAGLAGLALLVAGLVALASGQPWFVWFAFGFPGVVMALVFAISLTQLDGQYAEAEMRRSIAKDI
jgi:hypothetical protein